MKKLIALSIMVGFTLGSKLQAQVGLLWAKSMGGPNFDNSHAIAFDNLGNVYTTGVYSGTADFDPGPGVFNLTSSGSGENVFVSKLDAAGNFVWAKSMAGPGGGGGAAIFVDASNNILVAGHYEGAGDFDPGAGTFNLSSGGIFITKLDAAGNFIWAKNMGLEGDGALSIYVDASGNIYTTGYFYSTSDFDPGPGTANLTIAGGGFSDVFISKLNAAGNFVWAKSMGGTHTEYAKSITVDGNGNVYTTGVLKSTTADFDPGPAVFNLSVTALQDIFVSKLDISGNFVWAKNMTGPMDENGNSIALDASGNVYTTGYFYGTCDFDPGPAVFNLTASSNQEIFLSKFDATGNFLWAKQFPGDGDGVSLALDANGNIILTGMYYGTVDFDPGPGTYTLSAASPPYADIFVCRLDASGNFDWAGGFGGPNGGSDIGHGLVVDAFGDIYVTGWYSGTVDFDPGNGVFNITSTATSDVFVMKLSVSGGGLNAAENNISADHITLYPNPNDGNFRIVLNRDMESAQFILLNTLGQKILEEKIHAGANEIKAQSATPGIYTFLLVQDNGIITTGKINVR